MKLLKKPLSLFLVLVMAFSIVAFAGCGGDTPAEPTTPEEPITPEEPTTPDETIQPDDEMVLNVYHAYTNPDLIFEAFEEATGINVQYMGLSSGEVITRLRAEKDNPQADVWFAGGSDSFIQAMDEGLLQPYIAPNASRVPDAYKDADGYWTGMSLSMAAVLVNNTRLQNLGLPMPESWEDLTDPVYSGELLASDPNISGTAYTQVSAILQMKGEEAGWVFLDELYANIPYLEQRGRGPRIKALDGEYAVGICPEPQQAIISNPEVDLTAVFPSDGVPAWPNPVAIIEGAAHPNNAKILIDWILSDEGQQILMQALPCVPCTDVPTIEGVPQLSDLNMIAYDFITWGAERERVLAEFNSRYADLMD
ncbi:MAG: ABC transporter substrate-binding protein [Dehalococcoidia bacterium]